MVNICPEERYLGPRGREEERLPLPGTRRQVREYLLDLFQFIGVGVWSRERERGERGGT